MLQNAIRTIAILSSLSLAACGGGSAGENGTGAAGKIDTALSGDTFQPLASSTSSPLASTPPVAADGSDSKRVATGPASITEPPSSLGLDPYYKKYLDASGIPVVAAAEVDDRALFKAKHLIESMLAKRKDARDALVAASSRFLIIPKDKGITTLPEYSYLKQVPVPDGYASWDARARGMGGSHTSCGEENILRLPGDPYQGQGICVHEFAHTVLTSGVTMADPAFVSQLNSHYHAIRGREFIVNTYMATDVNEYWATAVQAWYNAGYCRAVPDGVYGPLCDHLSFGQLDPAGYELVNRVFNSLGGDLLY